MLSDSKENPLALIERQEGESGDWRIECTYYFDQFGKTFALKRETFYFNDKCTDTAVCEIIIQYFDQQFRSLEQDRKLAAVKDKILDKKLCGNPYEYSYKLLPTSTALLTHFKLAIRK